MTDEVKVRIGLPLPLDITNTITNLISRAYPTARMGMGTFDQMVLVIDPDDRLDVSDEEVAQNKATYSEVMAESVNTDGLTFSTPGEAGMILAQICKGMLDVDGLHAENYVEIEVEDKVTHKRYVVVACRSLDQTPHALRKQAEEAKTMAVEQQRQTILHFQEQTEGHSRAIAQTIMAMCSSTHAQPCAQCEDATRIAMTIPSKETV